MDSSLAEISESLKNERKRRRQVIGSRIRTLRKSLNLNLTQLSEQMGDRGLTLSASQLSRIENGDVPIDDDQRIVLCSVLNVPEAELRGEAELEPWFITRKDIAWRHLEEVTAGIRVNVSEGSAHEELIREKVYQYVPLEPSMDYAGEKDRAADELSMQPIMRKFLVQITAADLIEVDGQESIKGLVSHSGEEIMFVLSGQLYFWFRQPSGGKIENRLLKEGDCVQFSSQIEHGFSATGKEGVAQALFVFSDIQLTPRLVNEQRRSQKSQRAEQF